MPLFVVSDDCLEQVFEPLIAAAVVFTGDLQQQFLHLVETPQRVARNGVREARAQHHELVLALIFGRPVSTAHGVVQPPQLALGGGVHIAHAADDAVRLIVQIEAVADQLLQIDLGRTFETGAAIVATVTTAVIPAAFPTRPALVPAALARRPGFAASGFLLLRHRIKPHWPVWPIPWRPSRPAST